MNILCIEIISGKKKKSSTGGEVYVLLIKNVTVNDTDMYVCEVNSDPVLKSFHPLQVKSKKSPKTMEDTNSETNTSSADNPNAVVGSSIPHDFSQCCDNYNVSNKCMGFCSIQNIIDGNTGIEPEACEVDFPNIVNCMADGRNHVPCCEKAGIPDICQVSHNLAAIFFIMF